MATVAGQHHVSVTTVVDALDQAAIATVNQAVGRPPAHPGPGLPHRGQAAWSSDHGGSTTRSDRGPGPHRPRQRRGPGRASCLPGPAPTARMSGVPSDPPSAVRPALEDAVAQFLATARAIDPSMWDRVGHRSVERAPALRPRGAGDGRPVRLPRRRRRAHRSRAGRRGRLLPHRPVDGRGPRGHRHAGDGRGRRRRPTTWWPGPTTWRRPCWPRVAATDDDRVVVHFAGWLRFDDYLVTRVAELVLHTFDLQLACGLAVEAPAACTRRGQPVPPGPGRPGRPVRPGPGPDRTGGAGRLQRARLTSPGSPGTRRGGAVRWATADSGEVPCDSP